MEREPLLFKTPGEKRPVVDEKTLQVQFDFPEDVKPLDRAYADQVDSEFAELVKVGMNLESLYQEVISKLTIKVN